MPSIPGVLAILLALCALAPSALAVAVPVRAGHHSVVGGTGIETYEVLAGEDLTLAVLPGGRWRSGAGHPHTGPEGLPGTPFTHAGFTAPLGALVGEIGGLHRMIGAGFDGRAWASGRLRLFHWGEAAEDAEGEVAVLIALSSAGPGVVPVVPVPAPAGAALLGLGALAAVGLGRRAGLLRVTPPGA